MTLITNDMPLLGEVVADEDTKYPTHAEIDAEVAKIEKAKPADETPKPKAITATAELEPITADLDGVVVELDETAPANTVPEKPEDYTMDEWNLTAARELAYEKHAKQTDKSGRPYREHLLGVYRGVVVLGGSVDAQCAAFLHDIIEDTSVTAKQLGEKYGFSDEVVIAVEAVTKRSQEEQSKYLARIIEAGEDAMIVKVADLLHNTRPDRLAELPDYTRTRLLKKYRPSIARLLLELERIADEDTQKKLATVPVGSTYGSSYTVGQSNYWSDDQIFKGDWITGTPAPVKSVQDHPTLGKIFLLEDNSFVAIRENTQKKRQASVWEAQDVDEKLSTNPKWTPLGTASIYIERADSVAELKANMVKAIEKSAGVSHFPSSKTAKTTYIGIKNELDRHILKKDNTCKCGTPLGNNRGLTISELHRQHLATILSS